MKQNWMSAPKEKPYQPPGFLSKLENVFNFDPNKKVREDKKKSDDSTLNDKSNETDNSINSTNSMTTEQLIDDISNRLLEPIVRHLARAIAEEIVHELNDDKHVSENSTEDKQPSIKDLAQQLVKAVAQQRQQEFHKSVASAPPNTSTSSCVSEENTKFDAPIESENGPIG